MSGLRERAGELGTGIVEATFCFIVFFTLVMGVFEGGMYMKNDLAVANTVRAGSRALSAVGNELRADLYTLVNISRETEALNRSSIVRIVVYKPSKFGEAPSSTCKAGTPVSGVCNVYTMTSVAQAVAQVAEEADALADGRSPDPAKLVFGCKTTSPDRYWCPTTRKVTRSGTGAEYVGVWMRVNHKWVTRMFGSSATIDDQSIIRLEPRAE